MIIDLDPSPQNSFQQVIEAALATKEVLDQYKIPSYCKTSGSTGIHIFVPMGAKYTFDQVKDFAHIMAQMVMQKLPDTTTLERTIKKRGPKIYLDYLQNRSGQTVASVYSVRPKPGATVSMPLEWDEVKEGIQISDFNIHNAIDRIKKKGDIFAPVLGKGIEMEKVLDI
jgi:bifunctional non-homologous end joining protein LigD